MNKRDVHPDDLPAKGVVEIDILYKALEYVKDYTLAIDGGANKGAWSIELSKHFKEVLAFEPHAGAFMRLAKNVRDIHNIQPIEQALGPRIKDVGLKVRRKAGFTDAHVDTDGEGTQMVCLDYYKLENIGLVKLDLEGFEYFALQGMKETLRHNNPVIVIESIPRFDTRYGITPRKDLDFLEALGFKQVHKQPPNRIFVRK